jgi:hypothetical protein
VSEAQVTVGYLAKRASTSGGQWDTGGGDGELRRGRGRQIGGRRGGDRWGGWSSGENRQWLGLGK